MATNFLNFNFQVFLKYPYSSCSGCDPYSEKACRDVANSFGLAFGGKSTANHGTKGCFVILGGSGDDIVFYGTGGTVDQKKSLLSGRYYRPFGHDCETSGI